ncbi:MAG: hypothetical protein ACRC3H_04330 [Lachnospiraceae bacterium]
MINTAASVYGDTAVAAMGIVTRIYDRLQEAIRVSLIWSTVFCCVMALLSVFFAPQIISAFSQGDVSVIEIGSKALINGGIIHEAKPKPKRVTEKTRRLK